MNSRAGPAWEAEGHRRRHEQAFRDWFGLQAAQASLLADLHEAQGAIVSAPRAKRVRQALQVQVHLLRRAMDPGAVRTRSGRGYELTEAGLAECRRALDEASAVSASASARQDGGSAEARRPAPAVCAHAPTR
jgi:uncharacterized protein YjhX (UPF0386 family)